MVRSSLRASSPLNTDFSLSILRLESPEKKSPGSVKKKSGCFLERQRKIAGFLKSVWMDDKVTWPLSGSSPGQVDDFRLVIPEWWRSSSSEVSLWSFYSSHVNQQLTKIRLKRSFIKYLVHIKIQTPKYLFQIFSLFSLVFCMNCKVLSESIQPAYTWHCADCPTSSKVAYWNYYNRAELLSRLSINRKIIIVIWSFDCELIIEVFLYRKHYRAFQLWGFAVFLCLMS